ncbi:MAG: endolytic transglycosylase MltG [Pseudomonadota bacterium]
MASGQPYYDDEPPRRRYRSLKVPDRSTFGEPPIQDYSTGRRKKRRSVLARLSTLLIMLIVAGGAGMGVLYYGNLQFHSPGPLTETKTVFIARGSGTSKIANTLEREGVISNAAIFQASVLARNVQSRLKAGEYSFEPGISMKAAMEKLVSGKVTTYKITIPEGLTSQQIVARVMAHADLTGEVAEVPPEGSLLPQTYVFRRGEKRANVLERMRAGQKNLVEKLWPARAQGLPVKTPGEALILASIVEKETGVASERRHVASVFVNRLHKGMRLQSDPTIIYGIVGGKGKLGRPILRSEIDKKTPYNTYRIDGLPPTPIANPGEASIAAVLNPLQTDDLYFVADGTGGHSFSKTLAEHNRKVRAWRKIEKAQRAKAEATQAAAEAASAATTSTESTSSEQQATVIPGVPLPPVPDTPAPADEAPAPEATAPEAEVPDSAAARSTRSASAIPVPRPKPNIKLKQ